MCIRDSIELEIWEERLTRENGKRIVSSFDLVICAVDKVKTRLLINRLAKEAGKPVSYTHLDVYKSQILGFLSGLTADSS